MELSIIQYKEIDCPFLNRSTRHKVYNAPINSNIHDNGGHPRFYLQPQLSEKTLCSETLSDMSWRSCKDSSIVSMDDYSFEQESSFHHSISDLASKTGYYSGKVKPHRPKLRRLRWRRKKNISINPRTSTFESGRTVRPYEYTLTDADALEYSDSSVTYDNATTFEDFGDLWVQSRDAFADRRDWLLAPVNDGRLDPTPKIQHFYTKCPQF